MHPVLIHLLYSGWSVEVTLLEKGKILAVGTHTKKAGLKVTDQLNGFEILGGTYYDIFWSRFQRSCQAALHSTARDPGSLEAQSAA